MTTLHCQSCCGELVSCITGVVATVLRHQVLNAKLLNASFLLHLIFFPGLDDHPPFPPLNTNTWFRQLTPQTNIITLYCVLVSELFAEEHWGTC